ncbi:hypothetical protein JZ751_004920 [Albula glossodonta]|uniref:Ig-like domain-containing protein n=1 Tax=Albula glossodonta TaxID=121402 RepID=A0A8T2P1S6_9TELE|nr:hypothetical protein JZ751_004920 [Albula glossodonta]
MSGKVRLTAVLQKVTVSSYCHPDCAAHPLTMILMAPLTALLLALSGLEALVLTQEKPISVSLGENVKMSCIYSSGSWTMSWYQQKSRGKPRYLLADSSRSTGLPSRFTYSKSGRTTYLHINGVTADDEAVYYCACAGCSADHSHSPSSPTLTLLPPSPTELSMGKATVVCLAQGFYPDSVTVSWEKDGRTVSDSEVQTSEAQRRSDGTYSTSSMLTLTSAQWSSGRPVSCELRHTALSAPLKRALSQAECGSQG